MTEECPVDRSDFQEISHGLDERIKLLLEQMEQRLMLEDAVRSLEILLDVQE